MAKIIKTYREELPQVRFIGKRYGNEDRNEMGSFSSQWEEWFREGWFSLLENANPPIEDAYLGLMGEKEGTFEYWVGMFFSPNAKVPEGFSHIDMEASPVGTVWIKGTESDGDVYSAENEALQAMNEAGLIPKGTWFFERYACPRFTTPDENGEVILDLCAVLEK